MRRSAGHFSLKLEVWFVLGLASILEISLLMWEFLMMYAVSAESSRTMSYFLFKGHLLGDP